MINDIKIQLEPSIGFKVDWKYGVKTMVLAINLDDEAEQYLMKILAQEQISSQELVKKLLRNHLSVLKPRQTVLERMGDYEQALFEGEVDLSARSVRKRKIAERLQARQAARQQS